MPVIDARAECGCSLSDRVKGFDAGIARGFWILQERSCVWHMLADKQILWCSCSNPLVLVLYAVSKYCRSTWSQYEPRTAGWTSVDHGHRTTS